MSGSASVIPSGRGIRESISNRVQAAQVCDQQHRLADAARGELLDDIDSAQATFAVDDGRRGRPDTGAHVGLGACDRDRTAMTSIDAPTAITVPARPLSSGTVEPAV